VPRLHGNRRAVLLARVDGVVAQLFLNAQDLVELGETLRSARGTSLDLASSDTHHYVGNRDILGLSRSVGNHDTPAVGVRVLGSLDRLGQSSDLVNLEQQGVGSLELNGLLDTQRVGYGQVVSNDLEVRGLVEVAPGLPVILGEGVLNGDDGVLGGQVLVQAGKLLVREPLGRVAVGVLEVKIVLLGVFLVELTGRNVHGDLNLASVAGRLDSLSDEIQSLRRALDIRSNTTLVTDVACGLAVLLLGQRLQLLVHLSTLAHGLGESRSRRWDDHELLKGQSTSGVRATVQDVHEGDWEDIRLLGAREVRDVGIERDTLMLSVHCCLLKDGKLCRQSIVYLVSCTSLSDGQGYTQDGIGTKLGLVGGSVKRVEEGVDLGLVLDIDVLLDKGRANDLVHVVDSLGDTLATPLGLVTITELASLVLAYRSRLASCKRSIMGWVVVVVMMIQHTGGSSGGDNGTVETELCYDINLDGGVATRVVDRTSVNDLDRHDGCVVSRLVWM
jgi:hypothetical protein